MDLYGDVSAFPTVFRRLPFIAENCTDWAVPNNYTTKSVKCKFFLHFALLRGGLLCGFGSPFVDSGSARIRKLAFCRFSAGNSQFFRCFWYIFLAFLEDMTILSNFGQNLLNILTIQEKRVRKIGFFDGFFAKSQFPFVVSDSDIQNNAKAHRFPDELSQWTTKIANF